MNRDYPTLGEATKVWARIAALSFGGPAGIDMSDTSGSGGLAGRVGATLGACPLSRGPNARTRMSACPSLDGHGPGATPTVIG